MLERSAGDLRHRLVEPEVEVVRELSPVEGDPPGGVVTDAHLPGPRTSTVRATPVEAFAIPQMRQAPMVGSSTTPMSPWAAGASLRSSRKSKGLGCSKTIGARLDAGSPTTTRKLVRLCSSSKKLAWKQI